MATDRAHVFALLVILALPLLAERAQVTKLVQPALHVAHNIHSDRLKLMASSSCRCKIKLLQCYVCQFTRSWTSFGGLVWKPSLSLHVLCKIKSWHCMKPFICCLIMSHIGSNWWQKEGVLPNLFCKLRFVSVHGSVWGELTLLLFENMLDITAVHCLYPEQLYAVAPQATKFPVSRWFH